MICTLAGAQHLGSNSCCLAGLYAAAHPHTFGNILISTPRLCHGLSAFVIDDVPFSPFLLFHYHTIHTHATTAQEHTHTWFWAHCISEIQSVADVSKNPILLFYCVSGDRGPSLRAQGHRTHQHKEPYLPFSVCVLPPHLSLPHTYTHSISAAVYSLLFIHSTSHEQTAPWMPWPQIHWNSNNSLPDYKKSGLSIWTQWLRASIYQGMGSVESWSHCKIALTDCANRVEKTFIVCFPFVIRW